MQIDIADADTSIHFCILALPDCVGSKQKRTDSQPTGNITLTLQGLQGCLSPISISHLTDFELELGKISESWKVRVDEQVNEPDFPTPTHHIQNRVCFSGLGFGRDLREASCLRRALRRHLMRANNAPAFLAA